MLKSMTINKTVWQIVSMIWDFEWENDNVNKSTWQSNYLFNIIQNWMTMFKTLCKGYKKFEKYNISCQSVLKSSWNWFQLVDRSKVKFLIS